MSQQARRFAGVPLNGVEAITSIGYVSGGYVLGTGDQIVASFSNQGSQRNLERQGADVEIVFVSGAGVKIDPIGSEPDTVLELMGTSSVPQGFASIFAYVVLGDGLAARYATAFSNVGGHGQALRTFGKIASQSQSRPAFASVGSRCFGLHPVQHREGLLASLRQHSLLFLERSTDDIPFHVIDLRPVDQHDIALVKALLEIGAIGDAAESPKIHRASLRLGIDRVESANHGVQSDGVGGRPAQHLGTPIRSKLRIVVTPFRPLGGLFDHVVRVRVVVHDKAPADTLDVFGVGRFGRARLGELRLRFRTSPKRYAREFQEIAQFGGIDDVRGGDLDLASTAYLGQLNRFDVLAVGFHAYRPERSRHGEAT